MKNGMYKVAATAALLCSVSLAQAEQSKVMYKITITNITANISFTPVLAATHWGSLKLFEVGKPASDELVAIAEGGDIEPLKSVWEESRRVFDVDNTEGLLAPGHSMSLTMGGSMRNPRSGRFSMASMLLPTNDTMVSLNGVKLPYSGSRTYLVNAYDAGSEPNDELCVNIPGPTCGGEPLSPAVDGEGYVYPSPTTHGEGDLPVSEYGWSGPVAKVTIKRMY